ncbi:hypothetical protein FQN54_008218 [Arachnomyces sp. PD_36]|nr:hypothetical protein FQN54_008218 [Arachnomyces sp. PD_36]
MADWDHLPPEIQLMILETLAQDSRSDITGSRKVCFASYATVCKEWQAVFERRNFQRLTLDLECLKDFKKIARRQKKFLRHIWLRIRLEPYDCPDCMKPEGEQRLIHNNAIIAKSISQLFIILNTWEQNDDHWNDKGVTLEISAHSISDSQHAFKDFYFESDVYSELVEEHNFHDPSHGWINGRRTSTPGIKSIFRILGKRETEPTFNVPDVNAVRSLLIRRQTRRQFGAVAFFQILNSLPRLEHINYEPWRDLSRIFQRSRDKGYIFTFEKFWPKTLKTLTLFEDFNGDFNQHFRKKLVFFGEHVRTPSSSMSKVLARLSHDQGLEQLSASFLVEAEAFFHACQSDWIWTNLESLALTSRLLDNIENSVKVQKINNMLHTAGVAARNMPKLEVMEIWTGGRQHATVFRYHAMKGSVALTWHSVWDLEFESRVIKIWENVACESAYGHHELRVEKHLIAPERIQSHADAIDNLVLRKQVLHPVSLNQIRIEAKKRDL